MKRHFLILDAFITLQSDDEALIDLFEQDYAWLGTSPKKAPSSSMADTCPCGKPAAEQKPIHIQAILDDREEHPRVAINDRVFSLKGHPGRTNHAHQLILREIFASIDTFHWIHGSVAAKNGRAYIFAGPSGVGKSTLLMALLNPDFAYVSDDLCPIHKKSGLVYPFPSSLRLSSDGPEKADGSQGGHRKEKTPVAVDELPCGVADKPVEMGCVFLLKGGEDASQYYRLEIGLKAEGMNAIESLAALEGVAVEKQDTGHPEWRVYCPKGRGLTRSIQRILHTHRHQIWNAFRSDSCRPGFSGDAAIERISTTEAAYELLGNLKYLPDVSAESNGASQNRLVELLSLCKLIDSVPCYRLSVGTLDSMRTLVLSCIGNAR